MYIRKIEIENIRSIGQFEMTFPEGREAGWHVLIGDNGAGKSTIVRSAALGLLKTNDFGATREDWNNWLNKNSKNGTITVKVYRHPTFDNGENETELELVNKVILFFQYLKIPETNDSSADIDKFGHVVIGKIVPESEQFVPPMKFDPRQGWFSVAYGPYRRFTGGNKEKEELFKSHPRLGAH
ncbi:MAG: AAA family ATPase, partial [Bacteroidetes bacterium]|nr:AAA family ATPase [Bacteroidota bacterium]